MRFRESFFSGFMGITTLIVCGVSWWLAVLITAVVITAYGILVSE